MACLFLFATHRTSRGRKRESLNTESELHKSETRSDTGVTTESIQERPHLIARLALLAARLARRSATTCRDVEELLAECQGGRAGSLSGTTSADRSIRATLPLGASISCDTLYDYILQWLWFVVRGSLAYCRLFTPPMNPPDRCGLASFGGRPLRSSYHCIVSLRPRALPIRPFQLRRRDWKIDENGPFILSHCREATLEACVCFWPCSTTYESSRMRQFALLSLFPLLSLAQQPTQTLELSGNTTTPIATPEDCVVIHAGAHIKSPDGALSGWVDLTYDEASCTWITVAIVRRVLLCLRSISLPCSIMVSSTHRRSLCSPSPLLSVLIAHIELQVAHPQQASRLVRELLDRWQSS